MDLRSVEWQSLTFVGERHQLHLCVNGADAPEIAGRIASGIGDAEFAIAGHIVADIGCSAEPTQDGSGVLLHVEALTVEE